MKSTFFKNYIVLDKVILILFGLFPLLPNKIKGLPVILLLLSSLINYFLKKKQKPITISKIKIRTFFIMSGLYFFYLLTFFYSANTNYFGRKLEIGLSIFIIPLTFSLSDNLLNQKAVLFFKKVYLLGISIFSIVFLTYMFFYKNERYPNGIYDVNFVRSSVDHIPLINTHPIYASIFIGIGILLLLSTFKKIKFYVFILILILFTSSTLILSSKMVIISLVITSFIFLFVSVSNIKYRLLSILFVLSTAILSIIYIPNLNHRFSELSKLATYQAVNQNNSSSIRNAINSCSLKLIKKSWLFGYGIGDVQNELNNSYASKSKILLQKQYNAHNQYLSIWLGTGIFGIIAFLYMLFFNFKLAIKNNDLLFLSILIFFSINLLTENLLERQSGVILFAFLINFFGLYHIKKLEKS